MLDPSPSEQPTGRRLAILIGIDDYLKGSGIPPLRNAVRDVQSVAQVLRDLHDYEVRLVLDGQATLAGLRGLLARSFLARFPTTRPILYFAGHGIADEKSRKPVARKGSLIPQDAKQDDLDTFLPMAEVQALLSGCRKHLPCCWTAALRGLQLVSDAQHPAPGDAVPRTLRALPA